MSNSNFTKRAIVEAFMELLNERPLSKITVKDIVERCGINRNTFYYHYQDILALLEEICEINFDKVVEQYPELSSLEECVEAAMQFAVENKRAVMHIYNSNNRSIYVNSLWRLCDHFVTKYLETVFPDTPLSDYDKHLITRYFKCSCFGLVIDWIRSGMKDEYIDGLHRLLTQSKGVADLLINNYLESYENQ